MREDLERKQGKIKKQLDDEMGVKVIKNTEGHTRKVQKRNMIWIIKEFLSIYI